MYHFIARVKNNKINVEAFYQELDRPMGRGLIHHAVSLCIRLELNKRNHAKKGDY